MTRWLRWWRRSPSARLTLLCFPHAGAGAGSYRPWAALVPETVNVCAVQLPGRQDRVAEPAFVEMAPLVDALTREASRNLDSPYAMFGHSMGGLVSFEVARRLERIGQPPVHLFVSGARAPSAWPQPRRQVQSLTDDEFAAELRRLNGTPEAVLADPALRHLTLPALRADFGVVDSYRYNPGGGPLGCPISAFGGLDDPQTSVSSLEAWRQVTEGDFRLRMLPGDHFFFQTAAGPLTLAVVADLLPFLQFSWPNR
jgi:medium-chain acyl-[acyl-carrier-protein] hydrolase